MEGKTGRNPPFSQKTGPKTIRPAEQKQDRRPPRFGFKTQESPNFLPEK